MVLRLLFLILLINNAQAADLKIITAEDYYNNNPSKERKAILDFIIHQFDGKSVTQSQIDELWNDYKIRESQELIRFQIVNQKLYVGNSTIKGIYLIKLLTYFEKLLKEYKIEDIDFIIYGRDEITLDENLDYNNTNIPTFMMSKNLDSKHEKNQLLLPDAHIIMKTWNHLTDIIPKANSNNPWSQKIEKVFWRGGTTGSAGIQYNIPNFDKLDRIKLVMMSKLYPKLVDAEFTRYTNFSQDKDGNNLHYILKELFPNNTKMVKEEDHLKYKYLISLDGNTCAWVRVPWIMLSNSVLVKQESRKIEWFYLGLEPYFHYIPLKNDLTDIFEKIEWMKNNDIKLQEISINAQNFIKNELMPENIDAHMSIILNKYATIQKDKKIHITLDPAKEAISMLSLLKILIYKLSDQFILWIKSWL